jgi:hypothetical protein
MALTKITNSAIADDIGLGGNPTTSTQTAGNSTTRIATTAFVSTAVANLVGSAPETLNTLAELATSIGNSATLSSTLTTSIATKLPLAGGTLTGNLSLGDNVKAQFGLDSDLQIYHDGSYSWIKDAGTGSLIVAATNLSLQNAATTKVYANFNDGGSSTIHYDGSPKLATTNTGIAVTGNITVGGTVDGIDIAARDATLTSTTTTAGAALPKAGGTMTGGLIVNSGTSTVASIQLNGGANSAANDNSSIFSKYSLVLNADSTNAISGRTINLRNGGTDKLVVSDTAITTTIPMHVVGASSVRNSIVANLTLDGGTLVQNPYDGFGFGINFTGRDYGNAVRNYAHIYSSIEDQSSSSGGGDAGFESLLSFSTNSGGASDTNPTEKMRITSAGNVGIGTTSPQSKLELNLATTSTSSAMNTNTVNDVQLIRAPFNASPHNTSGVGAKWGLRFVGRNDSNYDNTKSAAIYGVSEDTLGYNRSVGLAFHTSPFDAVNTERMRIDASGNVGIGTDSPIDRLDVVGSMRSVHNIVSNSQYTMLKIGSNRTVNDYGGLNKNYFTMSLATPGSSTNGASSSHAYGDLYFNLVDGSDTTLHPKMVLTYTGNLGIGTDAPTSQLHLHKDAGTAYLKQTNTANGQTLEIGNAYSLYTGANGAHSAIASDQVLAFATADAERMRIDSSGNVGIGNTSPSHPLTIGTGTIAAPHSGTPNMVLIGGLTAGLTISNTSNSGTGSIFFGDAANSTVGQIRYNHNTGDMAFTAEDDFTFAGGNVGIGTSSPARGLHVNNNGESFIRVTSSNTGNAGIEFGDQSDGVQGAIYQNSTDNSLRFNGYNNAERMRIDSSGNVIVGGTTAQASDAVTLLPDGEVSAAGFYFSNNIGAAMDDTGIRRATTSTMVFDTASTERMRIDSSGNLLVGTTNINPSQNAVEGIALSAGSYGGYLSAARNGGVVAQFARLTNDGSILDFRNSTASVGSIGNDTTALYVTGASTGIKFGSAAIWAVSGGGSTNSNGAKDLGAATVRWKDLYLSGGIYLGGTGAANKLDDYEEGTWTPALWQGTHTYTGQIGKYTKIGNMVTVWGKLVLSARGTSGSEFGIVGLPFAGIGSSAGYASVLGIHSGYGSAPLLPTGVDPTGASIEGTYAYFRGTHSTNATYNINQLNSSGEFTFALTYMTA